MMNKATMKTFSTVFGHLVPLVKAANQSAKHKVMHVVISAYTATNNFQCCFYNFLLGQFNFVVFQIVYFELQE